MKYQVAVTQLVPPAQAVPPPSAWQTVAHVPPTMQTWPDGHEIVLLQVPPASNPAGVQAGIQ